MVAVRKLFEWLEAEKLYPNIAKGVKGAKRDIVVMNCAAALVVGGKASDLKDGVELAQQTVDSGAALEKLKTFVEKAGNPGQLNKYI